MQMLPSIGKGVVVMVNANQGWMLNGEIRAAVGREHGWPVLKEVPVIGASSPGFAYAGTYEGASGKIGVTRDDGRLLVALASQPVLPVYPSAAGDFFARAINLRLRFAGADPARPSELTVVTGSKTEIFQRTDS